MGFLDRNGQQQIQLQAADAAAAQHPLQLAAESQNLASQTLDVVVHAMGRNSGAVSFDLKGLVSPNVTLAGEQPAADCVSAHMKPKMPERACLSCSAAIGGGCYLLVRTLAPG